MPLSFCDAREGVEPIVAHVLIRAASALLPTPGFPNCAVLTKCMPECRQHKCFKMFASQKLNGIGLAACAAVGYRGSVVQARAVGRLTIRLTIGCSLPSCPTLSSPSLVYILRSDSSRFPDESLWPPLLCRTPYSAFALDKRERFGICEY